MAGKPRRFLTSADGRTMSLTDWARALGVTPSSFSYRLRTRTVDEALALGGPVPQCRRHRGRTLTHNGRTLSISEWAAEAAVSENRLRARLKVMPLVVALRLGPQWEEIRVEMGGRRCTLRAACAELGVPYSTIKNRIYKGQDPQAALARPIGRRRHLVACWGEIKPLADWARDPRVIARGLTFNAIRARAARGVRGPALLAPARLIMRNQLDAAPPARHDRPGAAGAHGPCTHSPPRLSIPIQEDRTCVTS